MTVKYTVNRRVYVHFSARKLYRLGNVVVNILTKLVSSLSCYYTDSNDCLFLWFVLRYCRAPSARDCFTG